MNMSVSSLPHKVAQTVGESQLSEKLADAQDFIYQPILDWAVGSPFHTSALGHSIHPALTDLTLGCWISASIIDLVGGPQSRHGATILVGSGVAAAMPTAIAGAADFAEMTGAERRIAAVHALGADTGIFLLIGSLIARLRGRHTLGVGLALAGNMIVAVAGFFGGNLALNRGTARRATTGPHPTNSGSPMHGSKPAKAHS